MRAALVVRLLLQVVGLQFYRFGIVFQRAVY